MRKILLIFLCLSFVFFVSCVSNDETGTTENNTTNTLVNNNGTFGDVTNIVFSVDKNLSVTRDTKLDMPVFVNLYPMGEVGAEYVVDDDIELLVNNNLDLFLNILEAEMSEDSIIFDDKTALLTGTLKIGDLICANTTYISILTNKERPFDISMTDDELVAAIKQNAYLDAMCKYVKIDSPVIDVEKTKDFNNKISFTIKIYQNDDNISQRILNSQFNYVVLRFGENSQGFVCSCIFKDTSKSINGQMLSFAEAAEKNSIDLEKNFVDCTVEYSESVVSGYYVPCYVFTSKDTSASDENENVYNQIVVPMYDVEAIESGALVTQNDETTTQETVEETTLQANNSAYGDFVDGINIFDQITLNANITIDNDLRQSLPIFIDQYPSSFGGPEYEITQDVIDMLYADYYAYLDLLGIERDAIEETYEGNCIQIIAPDMPHIVVVPGGLSVGLESDLININSSVDEIKSFISNNNYFSALCKFMEISNPDISIRYIDEMGKRDAEIIITEKSDAISTNIINSSLHRIQMAINENSSLVFCYGVHIDMAETVKAPAISYSSALSSYKLENKGDILGCEVAYFSDICLGYYIPCYVFYSAEQTDTQKDNTKIKKTIVPMYDITAIEKTVSAVE